jgi:hypothetical protein
VRFAVPQGVEFWIFLLDHMVFQSLPFSVTYIDYGIKGCNRDVMKLRYVLGCFHGSGKGAAVNRMEGLILECFTRQVHLLFSRLI